MGIFEHFPYTNFHDLNLDKILERTQAAEQAVADSAAAAEAAAASAAAVESTVNTALNTANSAYSLAHTANNAAGAAQTTADQALALAQQDHREIIYIAVDPDYNTAELITNYTWAEIFELCMAEKVRFRMAYRDTFNPNVLDKLEFDGNIWYKHFNDETSPYSNSYIQIAWIYANITPTNAPSTSLVVRKVWLKNSLSGGFYENTVSLS